jgi:large subunit ribosomal protein L25
VRWHNLQGVGDSRPTIVDRDFVVATIAPPTVITEAAADPAAPAAAAAPAKGAGSKAPGKAAAPAKGAAPAAKAAPKPAAKKK